MKPRELSQTLAFILLKILVVLVPKPFLLVSYRHGYKIIPFSELTDRFYDM